MQHSIPQKSRNAMFDTREHFGRAIREIVDDGHRLTRVLKRDAGVGTDITGTTSHQKILHKRAALDGAASWSARHPGRCLRSDGLIVF